MQVPINIIINYKSKKFQSVLENTNIRQRRGLFWENIFDQFLQKKITWRRKKCEFCIPKSHLHFSSLKMLQKID